MLFRSELFRALATSPELFLKLVSLMVPLAISLGLPFGFALAVVFCVGRWSADREALAIESLGMPRLLWMRQVFLFSMGVSFFSCFASLQWAPVARGAFEEEIRDLLWRDFRNLSSSTDELEFSLSSKKNRDWLGGFGDRFEEEGQRVTLSIGAKLGDLWKNVRVLLWGSGGELLAILHAKEASVSFDGGQSIELFLRNVDFESLQSADRDGNFVSSSTFVSFEKWKKPLLFDLEERGIGNLTRRTSLREFMEKRKSGKLTPEQANGILNHFNKYASLGFSSASLAPLLVFCAFRKGRKETYANLFLGALVCLLYFAASSTFGGSIGQGGFGWWVSNGTSLIIGTILLKIKSLSA